MNRGVLQSSAAAVVQQMGGNPSSSWWSNMNNPLTHYNQQPEAASPFLPSLPLIPSWHDNYQQETIPAAAGSWSQLLLGGLVEEKGIGIGIGIGIGQFEVEPPAAKKFDKYWADEDISVKQENSGSSCYVYQYANEHQPITKPPAAAAWSHHHQITPTTAAVAASSPKSSVSSNMLDFSARRLPDHGRKQPPPDHRSSHQCNNSSTASGGAAVKKARVQPSATQSAFKVRKEKLGDRITALHQLVSPFGKTDTASVLLESIGYIRFLQTQIEALSLPYFGSGSRNMKQQQQQQQPQPSVQGERNCIFPEHPGQLLNDNCMKRNNASSDHQQDSYDEEILPKKDLRSRGLCLVPVSCTVQVGNDNGADYWAPALGTTFR